MLPFNDGDRVDVAAQKGYKSEDSRYRNGWRGTVVRSDGPDPRPGVERYRLILPVKPDIEPDQTVNVSRDRLRKLSLLELIAEAANG